MDAMDDDQEVGKGHVLEEFKEVQELRSLIASVENTYNEQVAKEASCERFTCKNGYYWHRWLNSIYNLPEFSL